MSVRKLQGTTIWYGIAFLIMAVLFYSSSQTYAQQSQIGTLHHVLANEPLKDVFAQFPIHYGGDVTDASQNYFKYVEFFMRKFAHFSTYFILGMAWYMAIHKQLGNWFIAAFIAWQAATGYADLDEFHQSLTGGRSPMFADVMLDSAGALTAVILTVVIQAIWRRIHA
ncbi:VanZ family protein [Weissella cibaria]|uniref:VanZ family protein n=1 Tax=Weissella cibaria TaxID=137591 RepID=UPI001CC7445C|nr:VanZ family protein [Weissella cibaria]MBZ6069842.1 VanZ family protein [Weissella cibaria]